MEPRTFYRIWSPTRGYWDGGYLREPSSWGSGPAMASVQLDVAQARRWLKSMHGGTNPPCPDARLVRVTVRRNGQHLADVYAENAALTEALKMARMHHEASTNVANADRAALRARVSEIEAQLTKPFAWPFEPAPLEAGT